MKLQEIMEGMKWDDPVDLLAVRNTDRDSVGRKFGPKTKQKILKKDIINAKGRHGPKSKLPESEDAQANLHEVTSTSHPIHNKELRKQYDVYVKRCDAAGKPHKSWGSWALDNDPATKLAEGFGDNFGRRSHSERVRDEAADLGEPAPATNFFGRGSRSAQSRNGSFNIMINGKVWSKDGQPVSFSDMNKAAAAVEKVKARMAERGQQGEVKVINGAR